MRKLRKGDRVCVVTRDLFGDQWVTAIVDRLSNDGKRAHLWTDPGHVALLLDVSELTRVKVIWNDTRKPVQPAKA